MFIFISVHSIVYNKDYNREGFYETIQGLPTWELGEKQALSSIYIWSENSSAKSEASFVLTAQTKTIERDWN